MKDFAPASERNKVPILHVLREILLPGDVVLEVGSGTGQHACYFACQLPHIRWQPTDLPGRLGSIRAYRRESALSNLLEPLELDLLSGDVPIDFANAVVCINTVHIVSWKGVENLFSLARGVLPSGGLLYVYGPYRYKDRDLEPSNVRFDLSLKTRDPDSGIRDFKAVDALARRQGFGFEQDRPMPANNRSIWWRKR